MQRLLLAVALLVIAACQTSPPSASPGASIAPSPTPIATSVAGVEGLVADLIAAGVPAKAGGVLSGEPIGGDGRLVCVGKESVQVYVFRDRAAAEAAAARIDPKDPWHIGNSIVEWIDTPHFWTRDRILVGYVGQDAATMTVLVGVLGQPFAQGAGGGGRGPLPRPDCT